MNKKQKKQILKQILANTVTSSGAGSKTGNEFSLMHQALNNELNQQHAQIPSSQSMASSNLHYGKRGQNLGSPIEDTAPRQKKLSNQEYFQLA